MSVIGRAITACVGSSVESSVNTDIEDAFILRTLSGSYENSRISQVGSYAFQGCKSLTSINFPNCKSVGSYAFESCFKLKTIDLPQCTYIGPYAFYDCSSLATVSLPMCEAIDRYAFWYCTKLTTANFPICKTIGIQAFDGVSKLTSVSFPECTTITFGAFRNTRLSTISLPKCINISGTEVFQKCFSLISLYLLNSRVAALSNSNTFSSTPIGGYSASAGRFGSIFVKSSLLTSWKAATNWTYFSTRFVGQ